jgi:nitrogen fixation NifU-like protein
MLTDEIKGKSLEDVARIGVPQVLEELGIEISPARLKCALLSLDTLRRALAGRMAWQAQAPTEVDA